MVRKEEWSNEGWDNEEEEETWGRVKPRKIGDRKTGDRRPSGEANKGKTVEIDLLGGGSVTMGRCKRRGIPSMDIPAHLPTPEVARLIPLEVARELMAVPLAMEEEVLTVAMASPDDRESIDALVEITGYQVFPVLSPLDQLEAALQRVEALCYGDSCDQPSREEEQHAAH